MINLCRVLFQKMQPNLLNNRESFLHRRIKPKSYSHTFVLTWPLLIHSDWNLSFIARFCTRNNVLSKGKHPQIAGFNCTIF